MRCGSDVRCVLRPGLPGERDIAAVRDRQRPGTQRGVGPRSGLPVGPEQTPVGVGRWCVDARVGRRLAVDAADEAGLALHVGQRESGAGEDRRRGVPAPRRVADLVDATTEGAVVDHDGHPGRPRARGSGSRSRRSRDEAQPGRRGCEDPGGEAGELESQWSGHRVTVTTLEPLRLPYSPPELDLGLAELGGLEPDLDDALGVRLLLDLLAEELHDDALPRLQAGELHRELARRAARWRDPWP